MGRRRLSRCDDKDDWPARMSRWYSCPRGRGPRLKGVAVRPTGALCPRVRSARRVMAVNGAKCVRHRRPELGRLAVTAALLWQVFAQPGPPVAGAAELADPIAPDSDISISMDTPPTTVPSDAGVQQAAALPGTTLPALPRPVALGLYEPSFPNGLSRLADYEHRSGRKFAIVHWYAQWGGWKRAFDPADLELVSARGSVPMITWEPWDGDPSHPIDPAWSLRNGILSGKYDAYIESWARGLANYARPVLLRFAHEMHHNPGYPWAVGVNGNTPEDYVAAWHHVRAIFARYPTSNVKWVWNPHTIAGASASVYAPVYQSVYPGDDAVDWVGLDVYNTGPLLAWGTPYWRSFSEALAPMYEAITTVSNKPVLLGEVGSAEAGGSKSEWITSALTREVAQFPRVRALIWFDVNKEQPWNVDSSGAALTAWLSAISQPHLSGTAETLAS
jgi:beta-mannanase